MKIEPLKQQGFSPDGKDKIGQDIEERDIGKLARHNKATITGPVSKTASNFNRARIPLGEEPKGSELEESSKESYGKRMEPEFQSSVKNITKEE